MTAGGLQLYGTPRAATRDSGGPDHAPRTGDRSGLGQALLADDRLATDERLWMPLEWMRLERPT
jgi:hypothetical protein